MERRPIRVSRDEFLDRFWDPKKGQHVTVLAPNGWGKTHLLGELVSWTANKNYQVIVLVMKPRDETMDKLTKDNEYRLIRTWPPGPNIMRIKPPGYTLWPPHSFDPDIDDPKLANEFRRAMLSAYRRGNKIILIDELPGVTNELGLHREVRTILTRGRSMGTSLWSGSQRPRNNPMESYSQAMHLFLGNIADEQDRKRFGEIGGVDPKRIIRETSELAKHEWLYIERDTGGMCVIEA